MESFSRTDRRQETLEQRVVQPQQLLEIGNAAALQHGAPIQRINEAIERHLEAAVDLPQQSHDCGVQLDVLRAEQQVHGRNALAVVHGADDFDDVT